MKSRILAILTAGVLGGVWAVQAQTNTAATNKPPDYDKLFESDRQKFSYALGMYYGTSVHNTIKQSDIDADMSMLMKAFTESARGDLTLITVAQMQEIIGALRNEVSAKDNAKRAKIAEDNKKAGDDFLAKNKSAPGVKTTPSGLQYKVLQDAKGEKPTTTDIVSVMYRGTLMDGTEFDSSYKRNKPEEFPLTGVIPGWTEGLQLMPVGSKYQFWIPSELAYGARGQGAIGPNSMLIFEVELGSKKANPSPAARGEPMTSDIVKVPSAEAMARGEKIETIKQSDLEKERQRLMTNSVTNTATKPK